MTEPKLSDYGLIGNCCSAALVSKNGSIDWCCLPDFHSPSVFAAILDRKKGGYFSLRPHAQCQSFQNYLADTNVLETSFTTSEGAVKVIDAFTAMSEEKKRLSLFPDHEILRVVEGVSGVVTMRLDYSPRIFYGKKIPHLKNRKKLGIEFGWKENIFILLTTPHSKVMAWVGLDRVIKLCEKYAFVLTVGLHIVNAIHPRMARPFQGPTPTRQLEPPGFLALNYGKGTPLVTFLAHLIYGAVLAVFYN